MAFRVPPAPLLAVTLGLTALACRAVLGIEEQPPANDAGPSADASDEPSDGGATDASADGPRYCDTVKPKPALCADFDRDALRDPWKNDPFLARGTIDLDPFNVSPPYSARIALPVLLDENDHAGAFFVSELPTSPPHLGLRLEIRIDTESFPRGSDGRVTIVHFEFGLDNLVRIARNKTGGWLQVYEGPNLIASEPFTEAWPVGEWRPLSVIFHNDGTDAGPGEVVVGLGGLATAAPLPATFTKTAPFRVGVGAIASWGPMGVFRFNIDNVVIQLPKSR